MSEMFDEIGWIVKAQAGDARAFSVLADRYWEPLRRWLYSISGQDALAEDIVQDSLLRAWRELKGLRNAAMFRVWLYSIARNLLRDHERDLRQRLRDNDAFELADSGQGPLDDLLEREGWRELQAALGRLPEAYREAYLLWNQEGWPYQQIAEVCGVSEETARWRVCVARQLLVKNIRAYLKP